MLKMRNVSTTLLALMCYLMIFTGCTSRAANADKSKKAGPRATIKQSLDNNKPVFVFFYADRIKDSKKNLDAVKKVAAANKGVFLAVEAESDVDLRYDYAVEYVPTLVVLKPGVGLSDMFVYDINIKQIDRTLKKDYKTPGIMKDVQTAVKGKKPTLLFFMADWCGYCQRVTPEVEAFKRDYGSQVNIITVDLDSLARGDVIDQLYSVEGVPVLVALDKNGAVHRRMGYEGNAYKLFEDVFGELGLKNTKAKKPGKKS